MAGFSKRTIDAARRLIRDPMFRVEKDGTIWKRVGLPDKNGAQSIGFQTGPKEWIPVPVKLAVYLNHVSSDVPSGNNWRITNTDNDITNNAADNLKLVEQLGGLRSNFSAKDIKEIKHDYHELGKSPLEIAQERSSAVNSIKLVLFGNSKSSNRR
jgi:hypothetical protein